MEPARAKFTLGFHCAPRVFELCGDVRDQQIVDLGAGEGYCARVVSAMGASRIEGIELSESMVALAKKQQPDNDDSIHYQQGNVTDLPYADDHFDLALGVFVYNYLNVADTRKSFGEVYRVLTQGGRFVFSVPHPAFPFIHTRREAPFYFDTAGLGYFSSRDQQCQGEIFCRDGSSLSVQMVPKTLDDYFEALATAGFDRLPEVRELGVTEDMIELDSGFFSPVKDIPLHLAFRIQK
jgi:SAM-dependent methyltransferase